VIGLYPDVDVQPSGSVTVTPLSHFCPVIGLYPVVDVQPSGSVTPGVVDIEDSIALAFALDDVPKNPVPCVKPKGVRTSEAYLF
jgi:hypothetical protein